MKLVGLVAANTTGELVEEVTRMGNALQRPSASLHTLLARPGFAVMTAGNVNSQRTASCEQVTLWFTGELFEDSAPASDTAAWLMERYLAKGAAGLYGLNGLYTVVIWDERKKRLELINDRYGLSRMYTWQGAGRFAFASELKAIARAPGYRPLINEITVADLLSVDYPLDQRTLLEGVSILPPASHLVVTGWQVQLTRYWEPAFTPRLDIGLDEAAEQLFRLVCKAVERRMTPATALLVTGGLDSRLIASAVYELGLQQQAQTFSLGPERCFDVSTGRRIAGLLGFAHRRIPVAPDFMARYSALCVERTEGNMNAHGAWILASEAPLRAAGVQAVMTGVGGEQISGRYSVVEKNFASVDEGVDWYFRQKFDHAVVKQLLRPEVYERVASESLESIRRSVISVADESLFNQFDGMSLYQHYRRHASTHDVLGPAVRPADPFYDNDLVDFALRLPPELRANGRLFLYILKKKFPQLARLPYNVMGESAEGGAWRPHINRARRLGIRALRKLLGVNLTFGPPGCVDHNTWLRTASREYVLAELLSEDCCEGIIDPASLRSLVEAHMSGRANAYRPLSALLTVSLFQQLVTHGEILPRPVAAAEEVEVQPAVAPMVGLATD